MSSSILWTFHVLALSSFLCETASVGRLDHLSGGDNSAVWSQELFYWNQWTGRICSWNINGCVSTDSKTWSNLQWDGYWKALLQNIHHMMIVNTTVTVCGWMSKNNQWFLLTTFWGYDDDDDVSYLTSKMSLHLFDSRLCFNLFY